MVLIEACRSQLSNCPNLLLNTIPWQRAVEEVVEQGDFSERLRAKVEEAQVLYHHKLKVSISGCPNGCSRPQTADVGVMGFVRPALLDEDACISCGACAEACPDQAISLVDGLPVFDREACQGCLQCSQACAQECISISRPGVRVLLGGKLGRKPHLAEKVCELESIADFKERLQNWLDDYLETRKPKERFASWWQRCHGAGDPAKSGG